MFFIQVSFAGVISEIGEKDDYSHWFYRPDYTLTFHSTRCSRPGTHHSLSMQPREAVIIRNIVPTSYLGYNQHWLQKSSGGNLMKKLSNPLLIFAPSLSAPGESPAPNLRMFSTSDKGKKPTVRAERRRPAGPGGAKPTGRAEAPVRRRPTQPQQPPPSSSYSQPVEDSSYTQQSYGGSSAGPSLPSFPSGSGGLGGAGGLGSLLGLLGKLPKKVLIVGAIFLCFAAACFIFYILPRMGLSRWTRAAMSSLTPARRVKSQPITCPRKK